MSDSGFNWATQPFGTNRSKARNKNRPSSYNAIGGQNDPAIAGALAEKMQKPLNQAGQQAGIDGLAGIMPEDHLRQVSDRINANITDAKNILRQLPDVALGGHIITSAICNAGGQKTVITISSNHQNILGSFGTQMVGVIQNYFDRDLPLAIEINKWVHNSLMVSGSTALLVLPETTIDHVINSRTAVGNESFEKERLRVCSAKYAILGGGREDMMTDSADSVAGLEHDTMSRDTPYNDYGYRVIDNFEMLKLNALDRRRANDMLTEVYVQQFGKYAGIKAFEAGNNDDSQESRLATALRDQTTGKVTLQKNYYQQDRSYGAAPLVVLRDPSTLERGSIGHPSWQLVPSEALSPIYDPTDPTKHVAYLGILDESGNFIKVASDGGYNASRYDQGVSSSDLPSTLVQQASMATSMNQNNGSAQPERLDYNRALDLYVNVVWDDFEKRCKNGILGRSYNVAKNEEVARLMFNITLQKKRCQIVFIPASLLTYIAYNYDESGVGESLTEMSKTIASQRLILQFAQTNQAYQASINRRRLNIKIDPREPDIQQASRMIIQNYMMNRQTMMPVNCIDPVNINQSIWRQAIEVNIEADPRYPQTKLEVEAIDPVIVEPQTELMENLAKLHMMGFMLTPEQVNQQLGDERAITNLLNNDMFRERIVDLQATTNFHLSDFIRKYVINSSILMDALKVIIEANKEAILEKFGGDKKNASIDIEELLINFVYGLTAALPDIETDDNLDKVSDEFTKYLDFITKAADLYFSPEMYKVNDQYTSLDGLNVAKQMFISYEMRKWMRNRGVTPDLEQMLVKDTSGRPMMNIFDDGIRFIQTVLPLITQFDKKIRGANDQANAANPARGGEAAKEDGAYDSSGGEGEGADGSGGEGGDFGGFEDTDFDDTGAGADAGGTDTDTSTDETTTDESAPTEDTTSTDEEKPKTDDEESTGDGTKDET